VFILKAYLAALGTEFHEKLTTSLIEHVYPDEGDVRDGALAGRSTINSLAGDE
jgi:hypothetical protein